MCKNNHLRRLSCLLLSLCLLTGTALPLALAEEEPGAITIDSLEDWENFARQCSLDTWSQGKTVTLNADLDLSGGSSVPTFGGTFLGQGHTLSGLHISAAGSNQGLFRFLQPGAVVQDLRVEGLVVPEGSRSTAGGLAGVNEGLIQNCSFRGTVSGENTIGGLVGRNAASGQIIGCETDGTVTGQTATGGIAGRNAGLLLKCVNRAGVNLTELEDQQNLLELDPEAALTDRNVSEEKDAAGILDGATDTGGIAGYSSGAIQSCTNRGGVGYPHVGYNSGGIVGRQSGYLAGCVNEGTILGRKDVGGIAGQAEPWLVLEPGGEQLDRLRTELDTLDRLVDRALTDAQNTGDQVSAHLSAMGTFTGDARDRSQQLLDRTMDFVDENMAEVNTLAADITQALDTISPALEDLSDTGLRIERLARRLERALDSMEQDAGEASARLRAAVEQLRQGERELNEASAELRAALDGFYNAVFPNGGAAPSLPSPEDLAAARERLRTAFTHLETAGEHLNGALAELRRVLEAADLSGALKDLESAAGDAADIGRLLESAFGSIEDGVDLLTRNGAPRFSTLGESAREASDGLFDALESLSQEMESLNHTARDSSDTLTGDLRAVSRQFNIVCNVMLDTLDSLDGRREENLVQDTSDEDIAATREGKMTGCRNTGDVEGDRNVGGVAGSMAIELDLDPEDDSADRFTFGSSYETKAVLQNCYNRGRVTAKKDCAGGIVGRMDLGTVLSCEGYGTAGSTGGDYIGGVAGYSDGMIRGCFAKASLSGRNYIGGVAGWASRLRDCWSIATITEGTECLGAVAGGIESGGVLTGNRFVDTGLAGVDGVSYAGRAEPVPFEELLSQPGIPPDLTGFTLTLLSEEETVAQIPFSYGEDLSQLSLPEPPEKEGCYGVWPDFDTSGLLSDITLEAVYEPWVTLVSSEEREEKRSLALAEGQFTREAALHVQPASITLREAVSSVHSEEDVWEVTLTGTELGEADRVPLRLLNRTGGRAEVQQYRDGQWIPVEAERNGSYLLVEMEGTEGIFRICPQTAGPGLFLPIGLGLILAGLALVMVLRRRKRSRKAVKEKTEEPAASPQ